MNPLPDFRKSCYFYVLWIAIVAISVHDAYLVVLYGHSIAQMEQNPAGLWLIRANEGGLTFLILAKGLGTVLCSSILLLWYRSKKPFLWPVITTVFLLQVTLLTYLVTQ